MPLLALRRSDSLAAPRHAMRMCLGNSWIWRCRHFTLAPPIGDQGRAVAEQLGGRLIDAGAGAEMELLFKTSLALDCNDWMRRKWERPK